MLARFAASGLGDERRKSGVLSITPGLPVDRFWELDAARGIAVILMVIYHFTWDLDHFGLYDADFLSGPWQAFGRSIGSGFLFLMGLSMTLAEQRRGRPFSYHAWRAAVVFAGGLLITLATWLFVGRGFVIFGILHLLGVAMLLAYPFLRLHRAWSLALGLSVLPLGFYLNSIRIDSPWLLWLGVKYEGAYMVDYYPVFPWLGMVLLGVYAGFTVYPRGKRRWQVPAWGSIAAVRGLCFLGRHSLLIYLLHQPLLLGIFRALGFRPV